MRKSRLNFKMTRQYHHYCYLIIVYTHKLGQENCTQRRWMKVEQRVGNNAVLIYRLSACIDGCKVASLTMNALPLNTLY